MKESIKQIKGKIALAVTCVVILIAALVRAPLTKTDYYVTYVFDGGVGSVTFSDIVLNPDSINQMKLWIEEDNKKKGTDKPITIINIIKLP